MADTGPSIDLGFRNVSLNPTGSVYIRIANNQYDSGFFTLSLRNRNTDQELWSKSGKFDGDFTYEIDPPIADIKNSTLAYTMFVIDNDGSGTYDIETEVSQDDHDPITDALLQKDGNVLPNPPHESTPIKGRIRFS